MDLGRFVRSVALVSATTLGAAAACRHRHFLRAVVGVPEDDALLEGPAFGARDEGTLLHRALRQAVETPDRTEAEVVADVLAWAAGPGQRDLAPVDEVELDRLERELLRVVTLFRDREQGTAGALRPLAGGLERGFGIGEDPPVELGEGAGSFALRGTIDRIDVAGRRAVIVDYKRSPGSVDRSAKACAEGIDLQLPLYAAAMETLLDREVVGIEWVAATRRRRRSRWCKDAEVLYGSRREGVAPVAEEREAWRAFLADAVERASLVVADVRAGGHALQMEDATRCGHCAFFAVCRTSFVRGRVPEATEEAGG